MVPVSLSARDWALTPDCSGQPPLLLSFAHSFIHSLSLTPSFILSTCSPIHPSIHPLTYPSIHSPSHSANLCLQGIWDVPGMAGPGRPPDGPTAQWLVGLGKCSGGGFCSSECEKPWNKWRLQTSGESPSGHQGLPPSLRYSREVTSLVARWALDSRRGFRSPSEQISSTLSPGSPDVEEGRGEVELKKRKIPRVCIPETRAHSGGCRCQCGVSLSAPSRSDISHCLRQTEAGRVSSALLSQAYTLVCRGGCGARPGSAQSLETL